ncbi:MAG: ABC transporter ATP-binding protein [Candidatus Aminicenantes bacterium]|nr:ABC transporter ATP-binding protein [Candidatus Aminicenantes bacterium]
MPDIIEVKNLTKCFGHFTAVNCINFNIKQGEILGFLGPNGAGKTTTIKMINGLLKKSSGEILVKDLDADTHRKELKKIMGYMSQKFSLYPLLNSLENIEFFGGISGLPGKIIKEKQTLIRETVDPTVLKLKSADIPPGIRQKIALFVCLMTDPEIILLDEPTSGVDPEVRRNFWSEIYTLKQQGKTILVSTHNLDEVEYADRLLIIHKGNLIVEGEPETLLKLHRKESVEELFKDAILKYEEDASGGQGALLKNRPLDPYKTSDKA